jgi:hypothetical protein
MKIHAHRRGISEIADLNRRRTVGQECGPCLLGVTLEIHGDVDIEIEQKLGHFLVAAQHHVIKLVERFD